MKRFFYGLFALLLLTSAFGQDWIRTGTGLGVEKFRLGGGIPGIAESKIYFVSTRTGHKEIWAMDYDGANQHALTHLGSISLSPRVSPDGSRVAFSSLTKSGWEILMYSLELDRLVT